MAAVVVVEREAANPGDARTGFMLELAEYYGLVFHLAKQMHQRLRHVGVASELDDLVQDGMVGLIQAAQSYEPQAGIRFTTFAYPRIAGAIKDALRRLDPLSQEQRQRVRDLQQTRARVQQARGRKPLESELSEALAVSVAELRHLEALDQTGQILGPLDPEQDAIVGPDQEDHLVWQQLGADVRACLALALEPAEQRVLVLRFWAGLKLEQVGGVLEMGAQAIHRTEVRARRKLRDCLAGKEWEVEEVRETLGEVERNLP